jgi:hypothetical protein
MSFLCSSQTDSTNNCGLIKIKGNELTQDGRTLSLDLTFDICHIPVGRFQSMTLVPMLQHATDSLLLPPIILNGTHAQKMYHRLVVFKGEKIAKGDAYLVLPNESPLLGDVSYKYKCSYQPWMKNASFVLVGLLKNESGKVVRCYVNLLTDNLYIAEEK